MVGLALDGSGEMKEVEVLPNNVAAFKASGYVEGELPKTETGKTEEVTETDKPTQRRRK